MLNPRIEKQNLTKEEAVKRVADFMREDDESFFRRIIQGLTVPEIEEFLDECPEFKKFWNDEDRKEKD